MPSWMKDAPALVRFSRQWLEHPETILRFVRWWRKKFGEMPVVAAFWGWEKVGVWWGPDYFPCHPSDESFRKTVSELELNGFRTFAWPSGYNWCEAIGDKGDGTYWWDGRKRFVEPNRKHLVVRPDGEVVHHDGFWLENGKFTQLCGGDVWSQEWFNGVVRELGLRGCDLIQVDQVVGGRIKDCWGEGHGHPQGPGIWETEAFRRQFETMRQVLKAIRPDGVVGVEGPNEMLNDIAGIQDYRDFEAKTDALAGLYAYLNHGYVPMFQSNALRDNLYALAYMAAEGQMPFFRPRLDDMDDERLALANGGFEFLSDNVRGPDGWERLTQFVPGLYLGWDLQSPLWDFSGCSNWSWLGYGAVLDRDVRHSGVYSLRIEPVTVDVADKDKPLQISQTIENVPEGEYELSAWVKGGVRPTPHGSLLVGTRRGEICRVELPTDGEWRQVAVRFQAKGDIRVILWAPVGAQFNIDDIALCRGGRPLVVRSDSSYVDFMRRWIAFYRGEARDWLADGFRVHPPEVRCDNVRLVARDVPSVCSSAYVREDGEKALVLVNGTPETRKVDFTWNGCVQTLLLAPAEMRLVRGDR